MWTQELQPAATAAATLAPSCSSSSSNVYEQPAAAADGTQQQQPAAAADGTQHHEQSGAAAGRSSSNVNIKAICKQVSKQVIK